MVAIVNRWRGQLKLAPTTAAALAAETEYVVSPLGQWKLFTLVNADTPDNSMIAAMLALPQQVLFVKMMGPAHLVTAHHETIDDFCASMTQSSTP